MGTYSYEEADGYRSAGGYPLEKDILSKVPENSYFSLDLLKQSTIKFTPQI